MLKVGITGGIGSGKSTVCQVFETLGIPVFYADRAAREIVDNDPGVSSQIKDLFGEEVYRNGKLDRKKVATIVFSDADLLQKMNAIIHPATIAFAKEWMEQQSAPYVIKEAAIFFETGSNKDMDVMVGVFAPPEVRIERIISRDTATRTSILDRMSKQMDDEEKMRRCDYIITNDGVSAIIPQVLMLHQIFLSKR